MPAFLSAQLTYLVDCKAEIASVQKEAEARENSAANENGVKICPSLIKVNTFRKVKRAGAQWIHSSNYFVHTGANGWNETIKSAAI